MLQPEENDHVFLNNYQAYINASDDDSGILSWGPN